MAVVDCGNGSVYIWIYIKITVKVRIKEKKRKKEMVFYILMLTVYEKCVKTMHKIFSYHSGLGIPGWLLGIEVNRYFIYKNRIPLKAVSG